MLGAYALGALPISSIFDGNFVVSAQNNYAKIAAGSALFSSDQQFACVVNTWDTPFTPLESGVASAGLKLEARQPDGVTKWPAYLANVKAASPTTLATTFATNSAATVLGGRVPNCFESWGAGAPAWYGSQAAGQVALHYTGVLRPVAGRSWFSAATTVTLSLAVAGSGFLRVTKTVSGTTTEVLLSGTAGVQLSEQDYLENGLRFSEVLTLNTGDQLDLYYVQNSETLGGLVVKAVLGSTQTQAAAQDAPVLGCGLFDDGTQPTGFTLPSLGKVQVQYDEGSAFTAQIECPLINPAEHDGFGYEYKVSESDANDEYLDVWYGGQVVYTLRKGRLVQVSMGEPSTPYAVFTGVIKDFGHAQNGVLTLDCLSFEHRLLETHTKNEPDALSYMCFGYKRQTATGEPVYGIPAYDNWSLEYCIQDHMYRAGVDASRLLQPLYVSKSDGTSTVVEYAGVSFHTLRARNVLGKPLRLERPVHYGNVGDRFTDVLPVDDAYKFPPENMKELWYRARDITDRYGYDLRFNSQGNVVLSTRANPSFAYDVTVTDAGGAGTRKTHPSAFAGTYLELSGTEAPTVTLDVVGARIDLSVPRGPDLGAWYDIRVVRLSDNAEMARVRDLAPAMDGDAAWFYDYRSSPSGDNATLYTIFSGDYDTYRVTLVPTLNNVADGKVRRLDTVFVYHTDPVRTKYSSTFSTAQNALDVSATGSADEQRNLVYVVGERKTTATDSEKLKTNPNNPDPEFIVSVAVDVDSIVNPTATNYIGLKRESMIMDPAIGDQDYADYLSRTLIYRYRVAKPPVLIEHTLMPVVEARDPVVAEETTYGTVSNKRTVFVTGYTHVCDTQGFRTELRTSAFPEFPSYEVRSDIDIDATFNGLPVTNVEVSYTSLSGHTQTNLPADGVVAQVADSAVVTVTVPVQPAAGGQPEYLDLTGQPWPPVPGTVFLEPPGGAGTTTRTYTMPDPLPSSPASPSQLIDFGATAPLAGSVFATFPAQQVSGQPVVTVTTWRKYGDGSLAAKDRVYTLTPDSYSDENCPFFYDISQKLQLLEVVYKGRSRMSPLLALSSLPTLLTVSVQYEQGEPGVASQVVTDSPFHHLMNIDFRLSNKRIYLPWKQGDGSAVYQRNTGITSYAVKYRPLGNFDANGDFLDPYDGTSPFYDPYTSELGELVQFKFDALVSGAYRVSVRSVSDPDTVVAWLTEPTAEPTNPDAHWQYLTAGAGKVFFWDGVDTVGEWNLRQSDEVSALTKGVFDSDEAEPVGQGWYAWNTERQGGKDGPLAVISGELDPATGKPVFGQGTYGTFFFQVECTNDDLADIAEQHATDGNPQYQLPRWASSAPTVPGKPAPNFTTGTDSAVVYTHLGPPTAVELFVDDWVAATPYNALDATAPYAAENWGAADADATIHNEKPVRLRFAVLPRPGVLWSGQQGEAEVKLTRQAHARILIFDQFIVGQGATWPNMSGDANAPAVEKRTVYTRRAQNDQHTIEFADTGYRKAHTFFNSTYPNATAVWVFAPANFKKNFRGVENEPLQFGDYLQVEEVPSFDPARSAGSPHSRYTIGFLSYLFYLSAYCQDRSGRRVWCMNRQFLDKAKIPANSYGDWWAPGQPGVAATSTSYRNELPVDQSRQHRRTIVCRQWTDEPGWADEQATTYGLASGVGAQLLKHKWSDHEPTATTLAGSAWPTLTIDNYSKYHTDGRAELPNSFSNLTRQLGGVAGGTTTTHLGNWTWEVDALPDGNSAWIPCVTRDWHPYFLVPPMCDPDDANAYARHYIYGIVDTSGYNSTNNTGQDAAKEAVWQSYVRGAFTPYSQNGQVRFIVGSSVDPTTSPNKPVPVDTFEYVRQSEISTFESLRGVYSRGPRPAEGVRKMVPEGPWYLNPYTYSTIVPQQARNKQPQPNFHATVTGWFAVKFRSEMLWESSTLFPVDSLNREYLAAMNLPQTRLRDQLTAAVSYDAGAWVGFKDDAEDGLVRADSTAVTPRNVFANGWMPVAVGPKLPETKELYFHLCLLNERRDTPI